MISPKNWQSYSSVSFLDRLEIAEDEELTVELASRQYHQLFQWWNRKKHESWKYQRAGNEALKQIREAYMALNTAEKISKYQSRKRFASKLGSISTAENGIFRSTYLGVARYLGKYFSLAKGPQLLAERTQNE